MVSLRASPAMPVENGRRAMENQRNQVPAIRRQRRRTKRLSESLSVLLTAAAVSPCRAWPSARIATTRKPPPPALTTTGTLDGSDGCEQPKSPRIPGPQLRQSDPWRRADRILFHSPQLLSLLTTTHHAPGRANFF